MSAIELIVEECLRLKEGNQELMLYRYDDGRWSAEMGNPVTCVMLGESSGEIRVSGDSMRDAVLNLYEALANAKSGQTTETTETSVLI